MKLLILFILIPILNGCAATYIVNEKSEDGYLSYVQAHKMSSANNSDSGELLLCFEGVYSYIVSTGPTRGNIVLAQFNTTNISKRSKQY